TATATCQCVGYNTGDGGGTPNALPRGVICAGRGTRRGVLHPAWIPHHRPVHQCRAVHAPGGYVGSSHPVPDPGAAVHEGGGAFHLPCRQRHGSAAGGHTIRGQGLHHVLGARTPSPRLQLVLVLQQPARVSCRV